MSKTHKAVARKMLNLRPGDVITGLNGFGSSSHKILVLARCGDDYFDFSLPADDINIARDPGGPYHWSEHEDLFRNAEGTAHDYIGLDAMVHEGIGMVPLRWYRELKGSDAARFLIEPGNLLGTLCEPGTIAKITAYLNRSGDDPAEHVKNMSLAMELIFAGSEEALTERRMRLLHILVNSDANLRARRHLEAIERSMQVDIEEQLFGRGNGMPLSQFLENIMRDMRREREQRG